MKLVTFNVNGIRARLHQLRELIARHEPDIIGLQETKVRDEEFPVGEIEALGYHPFFHGQKGHYGVALLSRTPLADCRRGFPDDGEDAQRRMVMGTATLADGTPLRILNGYFPNGERRDHPVKFPAKERFYADLRQYLQKHHDPSEALVVMGDFNISPQDIDIGIGEQNRKRWLREGKCSFLPEEREWFNELLGWGLVDSFRCVWPDRDDRFSWFDYRSRGFERDPRRGLRIDTILASRALVSMIRDAGVDYEIRAMEKPSDHCPVWVQLDGNA